MSDIDLDGAVSILDTSKVAAWFGNAVNASTTDPRWEGNLDGDGAISILDLSKMAGYFGRNVAATCPPPGTIAVDGATVTVNITEPGQNAYYTFTGTIDQYLGLGITQVIGLTGTVYILNPNGTSLKFGNFYSGGNDIDPPQLPATATYIIKVVPTPGTTGSLTLTLSSDTLGTIGIDGSSVTATISRPGENARYTFTGSTGQLLSVSITPGGLSGTVYVLRPDGNTLDFAQFYGSSGNAITPPALPSPGGTYTLKVEPGIATGSVTLALTTDWTATFKDRIGEYEAQDNCTVVSTDGDPITLVVRSQVAVDEHLDHHGLHDDVNANFIENFAALVEDNHSRFRDISWLPECKPSEIMRDEPAGYYVCGSDFGVPDAWCLQDRLHVRGHKQYAGDPQYAGLSVTALTPHYDTAYPAITGNTCEDPAPRVYNEHVILANQLGRGVSGFTAARDDVVTAWLASADHFVLDIQTWGNTAPRTQCNGDVASADGRVFMLATCSDFPGQC
jgi:hypothetical protein